MRRESLFKMMLASIGVAYGVYAGFYIWRTSFVLDGIRHFCLFDDAMISMQYAKSFAQGHGLVFFEGAERVEGFTNPLWVFLMSVIHLLPISLNLMSLPVQIAGALFLLASIVILARLAFSLSRGSLCVSTGAAILTASYYPLNTWSLQGMEVSLLLLLITLAVWQCTKARTLGRFCYGSYILLGVCTLLRIDAVVVLLGMTMFCCCFDRRFRFWHLVAGMVTLVLFLGGQTLFRWIYYGEFLPNTYYLKVTGYPFLLRVSRGFYCYMSFVLNANWIFVLGSLVYLLLKRDRNLWFLGWLFFIQSCYSIYVGGDAWEGLVGCNRYVCIVMPYLFIIASFCLKDLSKLLVSTFEGTRAHTRTALFVWLLLLFLSVINLNTMSGDLATLSDPFLVTQPFEVNGNQRRVQLAYHIKENTDSDDRVAVVYAGAIPYFMERPTIDLLGKMDKVIARLPMLQTEGLWKFIYFYPGHLKWDYEYSIGELEPDVVAQLWWGKEEAQTVLQKDYDKTVWNGNEVYVRRISAGE